ncbi:SGNH/GDSL hydrolase family protein [Alkalihalobacillus sp. BA299]|uniref:SGNH/GDSL hydrolase family protein n=1 Tax=Alkalihalobacillus sp. BA299 TaxID=2815938 RepID=UPI001ADA67AD|nr:SGNH/GDSL hydrolase family protein [Alkalihalobacillus sp. BA299]
MKNILFVLILLLCVTLLIFGKQQYDQKLNKIAKEAKETIGQPVSSQHDQKEPLQGEMELEIIDGIDPHLQDKLINAIANNESINLAIFGSNAMATAEGTETAWVNLVIDELKSTYGEELFDVQIFEVGNRTTYEVIESRIHSEVAQFHPDILLFEPLLLNDNGNATMDLTLSNITTIVTEIQANSPEVLVILQPPNPIYNPNYYFSQVSELEEFAETQGYVYIDHWEAWPDITDEAILDYIDRTRPNQKGHEVWASAVIEYFTGK